MQALSNKQAIAALLEKAAEGARSWETVGNSLLSKHLERGDMELLPFLTAFFYIPNTQKKINSQNQSPPFIPIQLYPPPLESIPEDWLQKWSEVLPLTTNSLIQSRFHDILWVREFSNKPYNHATSAARGYLAILASRQFYDTFTWLLALRRCCEIARDTNNGELLNDALKHLVDIVESATRNDCDPCVLDQLTLILQSILKKAVIKRCELINKTLLNVLAVVDDGLKRFWTNPPCFESLGRLKASTAGDHNSKRNIKEEIIHCWENASEQLTGFDRLFCLQRARDLCEEFSLPEMKKVIERTLEHLCKNGIEWLKIKALPLPQGVKVDQFNLDIARDIMDIARKKGWQSALDSIVYFPVAVDCEEIRRAIKNKPRFVPEKTFILNSAGIPVYCIERDEIEEFLLIQIETFIMAVSSSYIYQILKNIRTVCGPIKKKVLVEFFTNGFLDDECADAIARSMLDFWRGNYTASAHVLAPCIEAIIRKMAFEMGVSVYSFDGGGRGVRSLGQLLYDPDFVLVDQLWHRFFRNLMIDPRSLNLRNRLAHGLILNVGPKTAALLIYAACVLRKIGLYEGETRLI